MQTQTADLFLLDPATGSRAITGVGTRTSFQSLTQVILRPSEGDHVGWVPWAGEWVEWPTDRGEQLRADGRGDFTAPGAGRPPALGNGIDVAPEMMSASRGWKTK